MEGTSLSPAPHTPSSTPPVQKSQWWATEIGPLHMAYLSPHSYPLIHTHTPLTLLGAREVPVVIKAANSAPVHRLSTIINIIVLTLHCHCPLWLNQYFCQQWNMVSPWGRGSATLVYLRISSSLLMLMQWPLAVTAGVTRVEAYHRPSAGCDGKAIIALNASSCRFNALNKKYIFLHRCNLSQMYQHNFGQLFAQKRFIDQNELNMTLQSDTQVIWCGSTCRFPLPWNGNPPVSARLLPIFPNIISWSSGEP